MTLGTYGIVILVLCKFHCNVTFIFSLHIDDYLWFASLFFVPWEGSSWHCLPASLAVYGKTTVIIAQSNSAIDRMLQGHLAHLAAAIDKICSKTNRIYSNWSVVHPTKAIPNKFPVSHPLFTVPWASVGSFRCLFCR